MTSNSNDQGWSQPHPHVAPNCAFSNDCRTALYHLLPCPIARHEIELAHHINDTWQEISQIQHALERREAAISRLENDQSAQRAFLKGWSDRLQDVNEQNRQVEEHNRQAAELNRQNASRNQTHFESNRRFARLNIAYHDEIQRVRRQHDDRIDSVLATMHQETRANDMRRSILTTRQQRLATIEQRLAHREQQIAWREQSLQSWCDGVRTAYHRDIESIVEQARAILNSSNSTDHSSVIRAVREQHVDEDISVAPVPTRASERTARTIRDDFATSHARNIAINSVGDDAFPAEVGSTGRPASYVSFEEENELGQVRRLHRAQRTGVWGMARSRSPYPGFGEAEAPSMADEEEDESHSEHTGNEDSDFDAATTVVVGEEDDKDSQSELTEDDTSGSDTASLTLTTEGGDDDDDDGRGALPVIININHYRHIETTDHHHFMRDVGPSSMVATVDDYNFVVGQVLRDISAWLARVAASFER